VASKQAESGRTAAPAPRGRSRAHAGRGVVVVAPGGDEVRVLQAALRGQDVAVLAHATAPAGADDETTARAVVRALAAAGIQERRVVVLLPAQGMTLRQVQLPPAAPEQLSQIVAFEAQRHLPLPIEQLAVGYQVLAGKGQDANGAAVNGKPSAAATEALIAVIRKSELSRLERSLSEAGITVEGYAVDALAAVDACAPSLGPAPNGKAELVLAADGGCLHAHVLAGRSLLFSRSLGLDEEGWEVDLRRSLATFSLSHPEAPIYDVLLFGDARPADVGRAVGGEVRVGRLDATQGAGLAAPEAWLAPLGAARQWLGLGRYAVLMEPQGWAVADGARNRWQVLTASVLAAALLGGLVTWRLDAQKREAAEAAQAVKLARQTEQSGKLLRRLKRERDDLQAQVSALGVSASPPLEVLRAISARTPSDVWLTDMSYQEGKPVQIQGTSKSAAQATELLRALDGNPPFQRAELGFLRSAVEETLPVTRFRIDCYLPEAPVAAAVVPAAPARSPAGLLDGTAEGAP